MERTPRGEGGAAFIFWVNTKRMMKKQQNKGSMAEIDKFSKIKK